MVLIKISNILMLLKNGVIKRMPTTLLLKEITEEKRIVQE